MRVTRFDVSNDDPGGSVILTCAAPSSNGGKKVGTETHDEDTAAQNGNEHNRQNQFQPERIQAEVDNRCNTSFENTK